MMPTTFASRPLLTRSVQPQAPDLAAQPAPFGAHSFGSMPFLGLTGPAGPDQYVQQVGGYFRIHGYSYVQKVGGHYLIGYAGFSAKGSGTYFIAGPSHINPKHIPFAIGVRPLAVAAYLGTWSSERTYEQRLSGRYRLGTYPHAGMTAGWHALFGTFVSGGRGKFRQGAQRYSVAHTGAFQIVNAFTQRQHGWGGIYNRIECRACGFFAQGLALRTVLASGRFDIGYANYSALGDGHYSVLRNYRHEDIFGRYRIANDALRRYELYIGIDGEPDLTAAPDEVFASLPHTTAALAPGHEYRFVVRFRNEYGLASWNRDAWTITVDSAGAESPRAPSAPAEVTVQPAAGGTIRIRSLYLYPEDGDNRADTWRIYLRTGGADPDPVNDTPIELAMRQADGVAKLDYTSSAYAEGTEVRVIVRTYRAKSPPAESGNSDVNAALATSQGPDAPSGVALYGRTVGVR